MSAADVHLSTEVAAGSESAPDVDVNATEITIDGSGVPQQRNEWDDSPKGLHNDPNVTPMFAPIRTDTAFVEEQRGRMRSHEQTEDRKATNQYWEGKRHWDPTTFFPPLQWVPNYKCGEYLSGDVIAGLTVGFMLIPQAMAYGLLAHVEPIYGLYSSTWALLAYSLFGTSRQLAIGPTAVMSLLVGKATDPLMADNHADLDPDSAEYAAIVVQYSAMFAFTVGVLAIVMGMLRCGVIVNFMSHSVMGAFTTGAGVTIAVSQMKYLFGITVPKEYKKYVWKNVYYIIANIGDTHIGTLILAICCIGFLYSIKQWKKHDAKMKKSATVRKTATGDCWSVGAAHTWEQGDDVRDVVKDTCCGSETLYSVMKLAADLSALIMCVLASVWAGLYNMACDEATRRGGDVSNVTSSCPIDTVGTVPSGMPPLVMPDFEGGFAQFESIVPTAAIIALVGFLESMAVGQTFATKYKYDIDANQEFVAIGVSNLVASFFQGFPVVGSFSRTAVNGNSGARSVLGNAITGLIVLAGLVLLAPIDAFVSLPMAGLAAMIVTSVQSLILIDDFKHAYHADFRDFVVMMVTFLVVIGLGVKEGLFVGFVASIVANLQHSAYPHIAELGRIDPNPGAPSTLSKGSLVLKNIETHPDAETYAGILIVRVDSRIFFANCQVIRQWILQRLHNYCDSCEVKDEESSAGLRLSDPTGGLYTDRVVEHVIFDMQGTNEVDLSGLHMLTELCHELNDFRTNTMEKRTVEVTFGNVKALVKKRFDSGLLIAHMYNTNKAIARAATRIREITEMLAGDSNMKPEMKKKLSDEMEANVAKITSIKNNMTQTELENEEINATEERVFTTMRKAINACTKARFVRASQALGEDMVASRESYNGDIDPKQRVHRAAKRQDTGLLRHEAGAAEVS